MVQASGRRHAAEGRVVSTTWCAATSTHTGSKAIQTEYPEETLSLNPEHTPLLQLPVCRIGRRPGSSSSLSLKNPVQVSLGGSTAALGCDRTDPGEGGHVHCTAEMQDLELSAARHAAQTILSSIRSP